MVEKISVQIALEGGAEVARQLEGIGAAGQKAFADISASAEQVGGFKNLKPEEVTEKLKAMGITGVDALTKIQEAVKTAVKTETLVAGVQGVEAAFGALASTALPLLAAIAVAFVAAGKAALSFANNINEISDAAAKAGMDPQQYDRLSQAFRAVGISAEAAAAGITKLSQAADTAALDQVKNALTQLQEAATRGYGAQGSQQLQQLEAAATKAGAAGKAAREALVKLGLPIPIGAVQTLSELINETGSAEAGLVAFIKQLQAMPAGSERAKLAIQELGDAMGPELIAALATGKIDEFFAALQKGSQLTEEQVIAAAKAREAMNQLSAAWDNFKAKVISPIATPILNAISDAVPTIIAALQQLGSAISGTFQGLLNPLQSTQRELVAIGQALTNLWSIVQSGGVAAWTAVQNAIQGTIDMINRAIAKFLEWTGLGPGGASQAATGPSPRGRAGGGLIGGRGTGTSDSNLAWVSRGEHVMPARAVSQPGVLHFLEALRRSGGNLRHVLDGMGRFALGGLVPRPAVAFAGGGVAGGGSHRNLGTLTLVTSGGIVSGLTDARIAEALERVAVKSQVRSGGRKPSRYS